jgi:hypothetical protein
MKIEMRLGKASERFDRWIANSIKVSKRTLAEILKEQGKMIMKEVIQITPPMDHTSFSKGYSRVRNSITINASKAFFAHNPNLRNDPRFIARAKAQFPYLLTQTVDSAVKWYNANIDEKKHFIGGAKRRIWADQRKPILEKLFQKIGVTAGGWVPACDYFGIKYPDWMGRWSSVNKGKIGIYEQNGKFRFAATNNAIYRKSSALQDRINAVVIDSMNSQATKMRARMIAGIAAGVVNRDDLRWK